MLFRDPVRWAKAAVGTRWRFAILCFVQVAYSLCIIAAARMVVDVSVLRCTLGEALSTMEAWVWALLCAGALVSSAGFPVMYLVAMRAVLRQLESPKREE